MFGFCHIRGQGGDSVGVAVTEIIHGSLWTLHLNMQGLRCSLGLRTYVVWGIGGKWYLGVVVLHFGLSLHPVHASIL